MFSAETGRLYPTTLPTREPRGEVRRVRIGIVRRDRIAMEKPLVIRPWAKMRRLTSRIAAAGSDVSTS